MLKRWTTDDNNERVEEERSVRKETWRLIFALAVGRPRVGREGPAVHWSRVEERKGAMTP